MKKIGIIGAMELEIKLLLDNMDLKIKENISGFTYYSGIISGKDVVVTSCSIGKVNAAACTQLLIDKFNVNCIINTGIAGGLHNEVNICDVVISSNVTHHDVRKDQMKRWFPFKECFEGDNELIEIAISACEDIKTKKWRNHVGRIVSGECFVSDKKLKENIIEEYSHIV
jgi:adenosylhomocysteine nucleosidase